MIKELKSIIISTIITTLISAILGFLLIFLFGNKGKIEFVSNKMIDGNYQNIISIKNLQNNEYLKDIEIKIDNTINLEEVKIDGEIVYEKSIKIDKIDPKGILIIELISKENISKADIIVIKNNQEMEIESFNEYSDYKMRYLVLIVIYAVINLLISFLIIKKSSKEFSKIQEENKKRLLKEEKECDLLNQQMKEIKSQLDDEIKKTLIQQTLYIKEMNNMEKENELYRMLLKEKIESPLTKEELETLISKKVNNLKKSNIKYFKYEDILKIVSELYEIYNKDKPILKKESED